MFDREILKEGERFKREVIQEIWRDSDSTFTVMYPVPHIAYVKGFRGVYSRQVAKDIRKQLTALGIKEVHYERLRDGKFYAYKVLA